MSTKKLRPKSRKLQIRTCRTFSESFKRQKVKELVKGQIRVSEISTLYRVSRSAVYKWLYKYSRGHSPGAIQVVQMESESQKTKLYRERIAELERIIGQKQLELDFLHKLVEVSSQELGVDLKKNFGMKPSTGSENTQINSPTR